MCPRLALRINFINKKKNIRKYNYFKLKKTHNQVLFKFVFCIFKQMRQVKIAINPSTMQGQGLKKYVTANLTNQGIPGSSQIKTEPTTHVGTPIKVEGTNFKVATVAHTQVTRTNPRVITLSKEDQTNVSKCRNFLTTLIKLAAKDGQHVSGVLSYKKYIRIKLRIKKKCFKI